MKQSARTGVILICCITGIWIVSVGAWFRWQWNQAQSLYLAPQASPVVEVEQPVSETTEQTEKQEIQEEIIPQESPVTSQQPQPSTTPKVDMVDEIAQREQETLDLLYGYQDQFLSDLAQLYTRAKDDFFALPEGEQTVENRDNIAMGYALEAAILETECDRLVSQALAELATDLTRLGDDGAVVATMREAYLQKKTEEKNYFMSLLT